MFRSWVVVRLWARCAMQFLQHGPSSAGRWVDGVDVLSDVSWGANIWLKAVENVGWSSKHVFVLGGLEGFFILLLLRATNPNDTLGGGLTKLDTGLNPKVFVRFWWSKFLFEHHGKDSVYTFWSQFTKTQYSQRRGWVRCCVWKISDQHPFLPTVGEASVVGKRRRSCQTMV